MPHARFTWSVPVALAAGAILLAGCTGSSGHSTSVSSSSTKTSVSPPSSRSTTSGTGSGSGSVVANLQQDYVAVVQKVLPSVVQITTNTGLGSGVIYDAKGDIVTNDHVVGGATSFQVQLPGRTTPVAGTLVGAYPPDDLAVINIHLTSRLHPATLADSSRLQIGDIVLAMGNPLGFSSSVTDGIVSATGRTVPEPANGPTMGAVLPDVIQTSASINPGNSGGALVDLAGQVVGIPTLAAVDQQIGGAASGIGFAIPSNIVKDIAGQLVKYGHVVNSHRAELGIGAVDVVDGAGNPAGVGVASIVRGGPAGQAGIKVGDVIRAINGTMVIDSEQLRTLLAQLNPGQRAKVSYVTPNGAKHTASVTLGTLGGTTG